MDNKAPDAFRTISEAAEELDLPQHVLRFWETRFREIKPMKRGGGRRYYRPDDIELLRGIRHLLYGEGYTIRGVQRILREQGVKFVQAVWQEGAPQPPHGPREEDAMAEGDVGPEERAGPARGVAALLGRDLDEPQDELPERREPPLAGAPTPRIDAGDRAIHHAGAPELPRPRSEAASLPREAVDKLRAALSELAECRKLLAAAADRDAA